MAAQPLQPHPATPAADIDAVSVHAQRTRAGELMCRYLVTGRIDALHVPDRRSSRHVDGLWEDTCMEVFIRAPAAASYVEVNASPSGEWALYRFDGYRSGMRAVTATVAPRVACHGTARSLRLDLVVDLGAIGAQPLGPLELSVATVLKLRSGVLSYWALAHPDERPDFHHPAGFVLTLDPTGT